MLQNLVIYCFTDYPTLYKCTQFIYLQLCVLPDIFVGGLPCNGQIHQTNTYKYVAYLMTQIPD